MAAKHFYLDGAHVSCDKDPSPETIEALRSMIAAAKKMKAIRETAHPVIPVKNKRDYGTRN